MSINPIGPKIKHSIMSGYSGSVWSTVSNKSVNIHDDIWNLVDEALWNPVLRTVVASVSDLISDSSIVNNQ